MPEGVSANAKSRCRRVMALLGDKVDALVVTRPEDIAYLTHAHIEDSWVVVRRSGVWILSDSRFAEDISRDAPQARTIMRKTEPLPQLVMRACNRGQCRAIGFDRTELAVSTHADLRRALGRDKKLVSVSNPCRELRLNKDPREVRCISRALRIAERGFEAFRETIAPGMTERECRAELEYQVGRAGADGMAFPSIVAVDKASSRPHAKPGNARVGPESAILVDWGAVVGGYNCDLTRMLFLHSIKSRWQAIYQVVLEAQTRAIQEIRPGVRSGDIDAVARDFIVSKGYGKAFGHGLGHGLGLDIHEEPRLSPRCKTVLTPGMIVTVEPGVYLPGFGGVRIEDDVLVTESGHRILSRISRTMESAVV